MKNRLPRLFDWLALAALLAVVLFNLLAPPPAAPPQPVNTAVRTEVQRYMGYEVLPVRYLSLPYDLTMGANEQLAMLDIGFLLLAFVPIVLLLALREKPLLQAAVVLGSLLLLVISTATGFVFGTNLEPMRTMQELEGYLATTSFADAPTGVLAATAYRALAGFYEIFGSLPGQVSDGQDAITYPLLLAVFGFGCWLLRAVGKGQPRYLQALLGFVLVYVFFWLLLSSGIVWYGFLAVPLLLVLVFFAVQKTAGAPDALGKVSRYGFAGLVSLSLLLGFAQRFSNIQLTVMETDPQSGKRLYDPAYVKYQVGDLDARGVMGAYYPGLPNVVEEMNRERNSLIYNVGTRFHFFVAENDQRIFADNQLEMFDQLQAKLQSKAKVADLLRQAGFRYIMVDLNTPSGDKTPEKTLVERYKKFLMLLYQNPEIELMATDRVLQLPGGEKKYEYGLFGESVAPGSYAVFRIK